MTTWTQANTNGRLTPGTHVVRAVDRIEAAAAINVRRRLTYQSEIATSASGWVDIASWQTLRTEIMTDLLNAPTGSLGGLPTTPTTMQWLWPLEDADAGKVIVSGTAGVGEVALTDKLNGAGAWTDATWTTGQTPIRAVHVNEIRQSIEWLVRGRWTMPLYLPAGLFSVLPDTSWGGEMIGNNGANELRSAGLALLRDPDHPMRGLVGVTVRTSSAIELVADAACTVEVYRLLRQVDMAVDTPTWNEYDPSASAGWATAGGAGATDATQIGSLSLQANTPAQLTGQAVAQGLQAIVDGGEQSFLFRRQDTGSETITITGRLIVDFDLP